MKTHVTLYSSVNDSLVTSIAAFPGLPYPGLVIVAAGTVWRVLQVQVMMAEPGSIAFRENEPALVDVIAEPCEGIHK